MIKACVFDLDGTLLNSLSDIANSANYALTNNGYPQWDVEQYRSFVGDGILTLLQRALAGNNTPEDSMRLVNDFNVYYSSHYTEFTVPYGGIPELLNQLLEHGIYLAVLSNKPDHFTQNIVKESFPCINFSIIQGKIDKFAHKPDPASLQNILEDLQVKADQALYIGDSNVDVYTAHNAKLKVVGVTWGFRERSELEEAGADYIVDSPEDILKLVYNMNSLGL